MNRRLWRAGRLAALATALWGALASATTMFALDLDQLSRGADRVVRGKVVKTFSRWTTDGLRIVTDVELEVTESLKGSGATKVVVTQPGGVVGDLGQKVSGLASFEKGEEVVVFLEERGQHYTVAGLAQGKFRVERSQDGKAAFAVPDSVGDSVLLDPATKAPVPQRRAPLGLEELKVRVQSAQQGPLEPRRP